MNPSLTTGTIPIVRVETVPLPACVVALQIGATISRLDAIPVSVSSEACAAAAVRSRINATSMAESIIRNIACVADATRAEVRPS